MVNLKPMLGVLSFPYFILACNHCNYMLRVGLDGFWNADCDTDISTNTEFNGLKLILDTCMLILHILKSDCLHEKKNIYQGLVFLPSWDNKTLHYNEIVKGCMAAC